MKSPWDAYVEQQLKKPKVKKAFEGCPADGYQCASGEQDRTQARAHERSNLNAVCWQWPPKHNSFVSP